MKKVGRLTFLPSVTLNRVSNLLRAVLVGLFLSAIAILFHNSYSPFGLLIALFESSFGMYYFTKQYPSIYLGLIAFGTWIALVYQAGSFGISQEILVEGNINGFILLIGGLILNLFALIKGRKFK
jgi:hypothetical protein